MKIGTGVWYWYAVSWYLKWNTIQMKTFINKCVHYITVINMDVVIWYKNLAQCNARWALHSHWFFIVLICPNLSVGKLCEYEYHWRAHYIYWSTPWQACAHMFLRRAKGILFNKMKDSNHIMYTFSEKIFLNCMINAGNSHTFHLTFANKYNFS